MSWGRQHQMAQAFDAGTLDRCFEVARVSPLSLPSLLVYR